jgi:hypothetical protein
VLYVRQVAVVWQWRCGQVALAAMWRFVVLQLFFSTGHACKFGQLRFEASMLGFREFNFYAQVGPIPVYKILI